MGSFTYDAYSHIVSIDFGTTFSGSCYASSYDTETQDLNIVTNDAKHIRVVDLGQDTIIGTELWRELVNLYSTSEVKSNFELIMSEFFPPANKVPTVVVYDEQMHLLYWGKQAAQVATEKSPLEFVLENFKLKLPKSVWQKGAVIESGNMEQYIEVNMRATIDFFRVMYDNIFHQIHFHKLNPNIELTKDDIRFVITVPAVWNNAERNMMRNIAILAGLISEKEHESKLIIINESLAAALYCEREKAENKIPVGTNYIICDAGGGTVDIGSFVATESFDENQSFSRCQLTGDTGERCGSTYLDERMRQLLMRVLFRPNDMSFYPLESQKKEYGRLGFIDYSKEERKEIDVHVAQLMEQFNGDHGIKYNFAAPAPKAKSSCKAYNKDDDDDDDEEDDEEDDDPNTTIFELEYLNIIQKSKFRPVSEVAEYAEDPHTHKVYLKISHDTMRNLVFDPVIDATIELLEKQIDKIQDDVGATFLVGGFGRNSYLHYRIKNHFKIEENGKITGYRCGALYADDKGDTAAMRGALYYGLDDSRKPTQTDIIEEPYDDANDGSSIDHDGVKDASGTNHDGFVADDYNMVICYDIGYDFSSCSYLDLSDENNEADQEFVFIDEWPGTTEKTKRIPTAYKSASEWGAQVLNPTETKPEEFVVPTKLMSIVKVDCRRYLANLISAMQDHVCGVIEKNGTRVNRDKIRYCITMENSYKFFAQKSEMRQVAVRAGLITATDSVKRLLLIKRDDAAAMYFEEEHFRTEGNEKKTFNSKFLQISFSHDTCHLSLQEATKLAAYNDKKKERSKEPYFRNVRGIRSATLPFDFVQKLVLNLKAYADKDTQNHIKCSNHALSDQHEISYDPFSPDFKKGFLAYIKTDLDFSSNEQIQQISIRKEGCCKVYISVYDLLEYVFRPAIRDLVSDISRYSTQIDIINFCMDKIFLIGKLVEANDSTHSFLERIITKGISEVLNIGSEFITASENIKAESHILGAQIYAKDPTTYTERVARKTYVIGIQSYTVQEFKGEIKKKIEALEKEEGDNKDKIYDLEAEFALRGEQGPELYYQSENNPLSFVEKGPEDSTLLIERGRKVLEQDQVEGIERKFFAYEECLVYANIYVTEECDSDETLAQNKLTKGKYQRIHQFEIYLKKDKDDPMMNFDKNPLCFAVRMIQGSNEAVFEANVSPRIGRKIPEFRFPDEILVAQIYNDEDRIPKFESQRKEGPKHF